MRETAQDRATDSRRRQPLYAPARIIWAHGSGSALPDLVGGAILSLLLDPAAGQRVYWSLPLAQDFVAFDNTNRQVAAALPAVADRQDIWFSDALAALSRRHEVRLMTGDDAPALAALRDLLGRPALRDAKPDRRPAARVGDTRKLPLGMIWAAMFIDGAVRSSDSQLMAADEQIRVHRRGSSAGAADAIDRSLLALDQAWDRFAPVEVQ
jgi:hypothetical protein